VPCKDIVSLSFTKYNYNSADVATADYVVDILKYILLVYVSGLLFKFANRTPSGLFTPLSFVLLGCHTDVTMFQHVDKDVEYANGTTSAPTLTLRPGEAYNAGSTSTHLNCVPSVMHAIYSSSSLLSRHI
jgi:hypothetical protein